MKHAHPPVSEQFRECMNGIVRLIRDRGDLPDDLQELVDEVAASWRTGPLRPELLMDARVEMWRYLEEKHGDSTTIADLHDRTVRAALCLTQLPPAEIKDLQEWAADMLPEGS